MELVATLPWDNLHGVALPKEEALLEIYEEATEVYAGEAVKVSSVCLGVRAELEYIYTT